MPQAQISYICRKGVMCQYCLTAALPIVSSSLCLLSRFFANKYSGRLPLGGYFVYQQSVIQHLRLRALSVKKRHRAEETTEECAVHLQSYGT